MEYIRNMGDDILGWVGFSGLVAIVLSIFGYGQLHQRLATVEKRVAESSANGEAIAALSANSTHLQNDITEMKQDIKSLLVKVHTE